MVLAPLLLAGLMLPLVGAWAVAAAARRQPGVGRAVLAGATWTVLAVAAGLEALVAAGCALPALVVPLGGQGVPLLQVGPLTAPLVMAAALAFALYGPGGRRPPQRVVRLEMAVLGALAAGSPWLGLAWGADAVRIGFRLLPRRPGGPGSAFPARAGAGIGALMAIAAGLGFPEPAARDTGWAVLAAGLMGAAVAAALPLTAAALRAARPGPAGLAAALLPAVGWAGLVRTGWPAAQAGSPAAVAALWGSLGVIWLGALQSLALRDRVEALGYMWLSRAGLAGFGLAAGSAAARTGALVLLVNGVVSAGAIHLLAGQLSGAGGPGRPAPLATRPRRAWLTGLFLASAAGLPGTAGFAGEYPVLAGAMPHHPLAAMLAAAGTGLTAVSLLACFQRAAYGCRAAPGQGRARPAGDRGRWRAVVPLAVMVLAVGWFPQPLAGAAAVPAAVSREHADSVVRAAGGRARRVPPGESRSRTGTGGGPGAVRQTGSREGGPG
ncbi:putative Proton-translocating NADH-quinone oxidoreductase, chain M [Candidatus Hydrogenisulfobacillus filiaventi]|uniref:Putative Proton-translocating NADH-quinone oxidoreductase, chain M n=1 Tax=Candidatus Hydrogenisulfobacillus filiaventi TaxID=2707344 RepID=A0A6F8ZHA9_9FIRM|nr:putative Proton-translocating NADH-quinone oxidoreductase, chain M [Candidatus Hydrogenisulfobacillus filiaventi]